MQPQLRQTPPGAIVFHGRDAETELSTANRRHVSAGACPDDDDVDLTAIEPLCAIGPYGRRGDAGALPGAA